MKAEDQEGHEFLAIMQSPYIEISGNVFFHAEDEALLYKEDPKAIVELYD